MLKSIFLGHPVPTYCVICLPGRGGSGTLFALEYYNKFSRNWAFVGVTPNKEWYPAPNGTANQFEALEGIPIAVVHVEKLIEEVKAKYKLTHDKIFLAGFSAGAVVAIQTGSNSTSPLAGVICSNGAILDPSLLPHCKSSTPYLLTHSQDDNVFGWNERYLPMRSVLTERGYNVNVKEKSIGGHAITEDDFYDIEQFLLKNSS